MLKNLRRRLTVIFTAFTGAVLLVALGLSLAYALNNVEASYISNFSFKIDNIITQVVNTEMAAEASENTADAVVQVGRPYLVSIRKNDRLLTTKQAWTPATSQETLFAEAKQYAEESGLSYQQAEMGYIMGTYGVAEDLTEDVAPAQPVEEATAQNGEGATEAAAEAAPAEEGGGTASAANDDQDVDAGTGSILFPYDESVVAITVQSEYATGEENVFTLHGKENEAYRASYFSMPLMNSKGEDITYEVVLLESMEAQNRETLLLCLGYAGLALAGLAVLAFINWWLARLVLKPTAQGMQRQADFVAAASHELRSPLAVVRSSLSAARAAQNEEEALRYQQAAEAEAVRMSRLVDDLLLLAGGDAGTWRLQSQTVDVDTLLIETHEQFTPLARKRGLALQLDLPEETLPPVKGDKDRLRQILAVLLDNALQYAPKDSEVTLRAAQRKNKVFLEVADQGPGVPEEDRERVFDRFYRADAARGDKKHFGLGLSVARELAELHGGRLTAAETPGGGSTFRLQLPAHRPEKDTKELPL